MNCYVCAGGHLDTVACAICQHCGVALCRDHLDEDLLAPRTQGLVRRECTHHPVDSARAHATPRFSQLAGVRR